MFAETVTSQVKVWLIQLKILKHGKWCVEFSGSKPKEKRYGWRFLRLKTSNKSTPRVLTGSPAVGKVSLITLELKMVEERQKQPI